MHILILGGTGVISHYVVEKYRNMGHRVTVINRGNRRELNIDGVEYVNGNANSPEGLLAGVGNRFYDKILDFVTYDKSVMRMKAETLQKRCRQYVFISSVAVYERKQGIKSYTEKMPVANSLWPYGRRKSECESVLQSLYCNQKDCCYTIVRPGITCSEMFIPYSPIDSYNMPGYLIHCMLKEREILTADRGEDKIQVIHSADLTDNLYELLNRKESENECFNLCGDEYITSNQVLEKLSECLGVEAVACYVPRDEFMGKTDMEPLTEGGWHDSYSNEKVKQILGSAYRTGRNVLDNLCECVKYFLCHYEYAGWPETTEWQIRRVIEEAKEKGKAHIKYISACSDNKNHWAALYGKLDMKLCQARNLSEKRRINETCLARWLRLEMEQIHLADYFCRRGITRICIYGYGVLGRQVIKALEGTSVDILCVIDRETDSEKGNLMFRRSAAGLEQEYILVSVLSAAWTIVNLLKGLGCRHIILLDHVLDMLERDAVKKETDKRVYPELAKFRKIDEVNDLQAVNFGTGMGYYDFSYDGLPVRAFNFAMPQQSLEFDYKLMKYYQHKLSEGCLVCIVLTYDIFLADHIPEIDEINERYYSVLPETEVEPRCNTVFKVYMARQDLHQIEAEYALEENRDRSIQERQVEELLDIWNRQLGIPTHGTGVQRPEWRRDIDASKTWLKKILLLCTEKNWRPVIIVPPMSRLLLDRISMAFRKVNFYDILYTVIGEEIPVLDYSEDRVFCNPDLYGLPCFLAKKGAACFTGDVLRQTKILKDDLERSIDG